MRAVAIAALLCLVARPGTAQELSGLGASAPVALRLPLGEPVVLDGRLEEAAWAGGSGITDFRQNDPDVGQPATERTDVRVLFDSTTLYVGVRAYDSRPADLIARILARDQLMLVDPFTGQLQFASDDGVAVLIDAFRDKRNAIVFATNPNGAEFDAQITDQGREVNVAWRTVWRVAAARTDSGWSAEFEIPLRSIRHPDDGRAWGVNVFRMIRRKNEAVLWRSWSRDNAGFLKVGEAGEVAGIHGFAREGIGLDVNPSGIGRAVHGDVDGRRTPADAALDLKYELRPGVTADATWNTDFAQADVDDIQINLTRFDLFFPEKRDFFLENAGVFEFGSRGQFEPPPWLMFFSRRIGISDSGEIPVLGGVRLTGREGGQTFGAMLMHTQAAFDQSRASYGTARFKRDVGAGGYVGTMYTGLHNERPDPFDPASGRRVPATAQSYGGDFQYWLTPTTNVQGFAAQVAGGEAQGASPGDRLAHRLMITREVERWGLRLERMVFGPSAEPELGFATRVDIDRNDATVRLTFRPAMPGIRRLEIYNFGSYIAHVNGALQDWGYGPAVAFTFDSGDDITFYRVEAFTVLDESFDFADRLTVEPGRFDNDQRGVFINTAARRPISLALDVQEQRFYGGSLRFVTGTATMALGARASIAVTRAFNDVTVPAGHLITNVTAVRAGFAFSTRAQLSTTAQYNALEHRVSVNARMVYQYRPGSELFLVLNDDREDGIPRRDQPSTLLAKLTYLVRF
jgi:hypothetical protein